MCFTNDKADDPGHDAWTTGSATTVRTDHDDLIVEGVDCLQVHQGMNPNRTRCLIWEFPVDWNGIPTATKDATFCFPRFNGVTATRMPTGRNKMGIQNVGILSMPVLTIPMTSFLLSWTSRQPWSAIDTDVCQIHCGFVFGYPIPREREPVINRHARQRPKYVLKWKIIRFDCSRTSLFIQ